jgi:hypothetical protein
MRMEGHDEERELRDIHRRIDSLKEENERQFNSLTEKLHALEVAIARGGKFPAQATVAAVALVLAVIGHGAVLYSELQATKMQSATAYGLVEEHIKGLGVRQQQWAVLDERVKSLEGRVVGKSELGWHKPDHDAYAAVVEEHFRHVETRLRALEEKKR